LKKDLLIIAYKYRINTKHVLAMKTVSSNTTNGKKKLEKRTENIAVMEKMKNMIKTPTPLMVWLL